MINDLANTTMPPTLSLLIERIKSKQEAVHQWLTAYEGSKELPLYSSVDIRDAGFKVAVVDTNIFPAGFNNLCEHGLEDSVKLLREAILKRVANCKNILIIAEEHTRNKWYLEHIRILQQITEKAGFKAKVATFLSPTDEPSFCATDQFVELKTAADQPVRIFCFKKILENYKAGREKFCLIIMNNDLTAGIPEVLKNSKVPIYPSMAAGWHSRLKSHHFGHTRDLTEELGKIIDVDPWLFSCLFDAMQDIDINHVEDRVKLADHAQKLFDEIKIKYNEHNIKEKPYIMLKSDSGTYGMGVIPIEDPQEIIDLNRRKRNNLSIGKSAQVISRVLLQEGVPTIYHDGQEVCEVCIYQIENKMVGGFYRTHAAKSNRDNLNTQGMVLKKMCPHLDKYGNFCVHHDVNIFDVYRILARVAGVAAHREIIQLEDQPK